MKIALVHDCLTVFGGAEKILQQMIKLYPEAELFSLIDFLPDKHRAFLLGKKVTTTFLQKLPFVRYYYRYCLPFMPIAIEQIDLSRFDLIISISYAVAKGVLVAPKQKHISICCTPMRYIWDLTHHYFPSPNFIIRSILHKLRIWDVTSSHRVDQFIAISQFTKERIEKNYRREAEVIYPPVAVKKLPYQEKKENFYLTASRLVSYKRVDLIVNAFKEMPDKKLIVIGEGAEYKKLKKNQSSNIRFLGYQPEVVLHDYMKRAQAFIFAAKEDFGITPIEAMACGTPVIAYGLGGSAETILVEENENQTGLFFTEQSREALIEAVERFENSKEKIRPSSCRKWAERFSEERFQEEITKYISR